VGIVTAKQLQDGDTTCAGCGLRFYTGPRTDAWWYEGKPYCIGCFHETTQERHDPQVLLDVAERHSKHYADGSLGVGLEQDAAGASLLLTELGVPMGDEQGHYTLTYRIELMSRWIGR